MPGGRRAQWRRFCAEQEEVFKLVKNGVVVEVEEKTYFVAILF